jgi:hypothetical protein
MLGINKVLWQGAELYRAEAVNTATLERYGHGTPDDWLERTLYTPHTYTGIFILLALQFGKPPESIPEAIRYLSSKVGIAVLATALGVAVVFGPWIVPLRTGARLRRNKLAGGVPVTSGAKARGASGRGVGA